MESKLNKKIRDFIHDLSKYSVLFHIAVIVTLSFFQLDIFKDDFPKEYIVSVIIGISSFALGSNALDKIISKKTPKLKPYVKCPLCPGKMNPTGDWICEECNKHLVDEDKLKK